MDLAAVTWRKSSLSGSQGDCVELALTENEGAVRDSKNPGGTVLLMGRRSLDQAIAALKNDCSGC